MSKRSTGPRKAKQSARTVPAASVAPKPQPSERDLKVAQEAEQRIRARRKRPQVVAVPGKPGSAQSPHNDPEAFAASILDSFGTTSNAFMDRATAQLSAGMYRKGADPLDGVNAGLAVVAGIRPENEIEAMLAIQMAATHEAAMSMLATAAQNGTVQGIQTAGNLAVKLLRTYTAQIEALTKLRRGGEQTVRVEHVHVYPGGQAIVGHVSQEAAGGRGVIENSNQPHEPIHPETRPLAPSTTLWSEEPGRNAVPGSGGQREEAVLETRRSARKRSP